MGKSQTPPRAKFSVIPTTEADLDRLHSLGLGHVAQAFDRARLSEQSGGIYMRDGIDRRPLPGIIHRIALGH